MKYIMTIDRYSVFSKDHELKKDSNGKIDVHSLFESVPSKKVIINTTDLHYRFLKNDPLIELFNLHYIIFSDPIDVLKKSVIYSTDDVETIFSKFSSTGETFSENEYFITTQEHEELEFNSDDDAKLYCEIKE